jgi:hypothetical protein
MKPSILMVVCLWLPTAAAARGEDAAGHTRNVRFTYAAEVRAVPENAGKVTLWMPFPPNNDYQQISRINVRSDWPTSVNREDEFGNQILSLSIDLSMLREAGPFGSSCSST